MSTAPRTVNAYAAFEKSGQLKLWQYQSRPLGSEDVEIKISHCGICGSDVHALASNWGITTYPCVAGHEIIGEVSVAGADVKHLAVGDRVGVDTLAWACLNKGSSRPCTECADGADAYCSRAVWTFNMKHEDGTTTYGGFADFVRVSSHLAFKIPDNVPSDATAPLLCAGATVFTPLESYKVKVGDRVGIIGIGGLGHLAIQFIRALGAVPIAFSRSASEEQEIRALGAQEFYNLSDPEDAAKAFASVHLLLVTADATNMPYDTNLGLVRPRGTCVMLGLPSDKVQLTAPNLVARGINFARSMVGSIQDIKDMLALASNANVRAIIQKLPTSQVNEGLQRAREGSAHYRVILEI